jgi:hypothetical protein
MFGFRKKQPAPPAFDGLKIQPRIKHINFLKALDAAGVPPDQRPSTTPLCGELIVTYAFDLPDSFVMATPPLLAQAGLGDADVTARAMAYLQKQVPHPQSVARGACHLVQSGGELEAALLLLDAFWDARQAEVSGEILVSVPRRDRLLTCDSADAAGLASLRLQTEEFFIEHDDAHRLSKQIMVRRNGTWSLFESH